MSVEDEEYKEECRRWSWKMYWETIDRHQLGGRATPDKGAFLPSPAVVDKRIAMQAELRGHGFPEHFITSIMQYDTPTIRVVRASVARVGALATWRRYRNFLATTEYDRDYEE